MASIEKRGESYRVAWRWGGTRDGARESTTWPDETIAGRARDLVEARLHRVTRAEVYADILGLPPEQLQETKPAVPTVTEWADRWLASKTRITPGVRGQYRRQLDQQILPFWGLRGIDEVTGEDIATWIEAQRARGITDATVTRYYSTVHSMFEFARVEGHLSSNPARRTDFIRDLVAHDDDDNNETHVYLTPEEVDMLFSSAPESARPLLWFLLLTGARWGEATAVAVRHVTLTGKRPAVKLNRAWKKDDKGAWYLGATKGRTRRSQPLPRTLVPMLEPLADGRAPDDLLFRAARGGRVHHHNFRNRVFEPAVAEAMRCPDHLPRYEGKYPPSMRRPWMDVSTCECSTRLTRRPTPHDLRHTYTAWLIAAGKPLVAISRSLGHKSTAVTEAVYAGILPTVSEDLADALDVAVSGGKLVR